MIKSILLTVLLATASLATGLANTATFLGNTTGQPTFNRPTETGARSGIGTAVPFFVYQIDVVTGGLFTFNLNASNPAVYDTFLHLFSNAFNPADTSDPALNFLAGDDDASLSTTNSSLAFSLVSAGRYFLVVDGFANSDFGAYTATISSTSGFFRATAVPEGGSTLLLASLAFGSVVIARQRLQRTALCS